MSFNIEWTNADALTPKQFTVYESVPVTYSTTTAPFGDLQRENAKLRELVRDMNKWLWNGADCTECPFAAKCDLNAAFESDIHAHICLGWSEIHDRMRELGVDA